MTDSVTKAIERLADPEGPFAPRGAAIFVDAVLGTPLREAIDADRVVALTAGAIDEERVLHALRTLVRPTYERQRAALRERGDLLSAWLPADAESELVALARATRAPRGAWATRIVDPQHVRELLAPVLQDTLLAFARKLPLVSSAEESKAGKLLGGLARGIAQGAGERAAKLADLGRGVLGSVGAEMEKRVVSAARDFSQGAFEPLRDSFGERLKSEEGQAILEKMRAHAIKTLLATPLSELAQDLDAAPPDALDRLIARTIAHDAAREEVRVLLRAEVEAFLAAREGATVRDVLDEWRLTDEVGTEARRLIALGLRRACASGAVESWLRDLLEPGS